MSFMHHTIDGGKNIDFLSFMHFLSEWLFSSKRFQEKFGWSLKLEKYVQDNTRPSMDVTW